MNQDWRKEGEEVARLIREILRKREHKPVFTFQVGDKNSRIWDAQAEADYSLWHSEVSAANDQFDQDARNFKGY